MPFPPDSLPPDPKQLLPLRGLTLLAVEDSRFTCDVLRLYCHRSGARLRRAETLAAARDCLALHPPDLLLVDLGLPDGRGEGLIADCVAQDRAVIGLSGDPDGRALALAAGATGFMVKPLPSLAEFQRLVLAAFSGEDGGALADPAPLPPPDPLALHDDLARAAALIGVPGAADYVAGFLQSLGRAAGDAALERAAMASRGAPDPGPLQRLLADRLARTVPLA